MLLLSGLYKGHKLIVIIWYIFAWDLNTLKHSPSLSSTSTTTYYLFKKIQGSGYFYSESMQLWSREGFHHFTFMWWVYWTQYWTNKSWQRLQNIIGNISFTSIWEYQPITELSICSVTVTGGLPLGAAVPAESVTVGWGGCSILSSPGIPHSDIGGILGSFQSLIGGIVGNFHSETGGMVGKFHSDAGGKVGSFQSEAGAKDRS